MTAESNSYGRDLLAFLDGGPSRTRNLSDGDILVEQYERSSDVFVVLDGSLDALVESGDTVATVRRFEPGQLFGELTAISGGPRTATVRAKGPCSVAVVERHEFMRWLGATPQHADAVAARARDRVDRNRAAAMLAFVLGSDNADVLDEVLALVRWRTLEPAEILCEEGDESGSAYLILSGRVSVSSEQRIGSQRNVELGRNQIVGELGVLDRLPRTATVTALRRTTLAELPAEAVDRIIAKNPEVAVHLFRQALKRALHPEPRSDQAKAVSVVVTSPGVAEWLRRAAEGELAAHGSIVVVDSNHVDAHLGHPGVAQSDRGSVGASRVDELLHDLETSTDYLLMFGDGSPSEWTLRTAETADRTLVVSSAHPDPDELRLIAALDDRYRSERLRWWRLIVHSSSASNPADHDPRAATGDRVLHARTDNGSDAARAIRLLSGNAIGLALGGGGARGFGHIGAYRAMLESGIEPDVIVGTSIGSVFGLAIALDWTPDDMEMYAEESFSNLLDWTIPIVSFVKGQRISDNISKSFGDFRCESLWRPFSSVVTNLTHSRVDVRQSGPTDQAVRMSVSIPGVLPPMTENGEIFVDGGVLNNLPGDVVASDSSVRTVFALDVSPPMGPHVENPTEPSVSGFAMLALRARRRRIPYPSATNVVMQTMVAASGRDRKLLMDNGTIDFYLHLDIRGSSLLAFDNVGPVVSQGYDSAKAQLQELFPEGYPPTDLADSTV